MLTSSNQYLRPEYLTPLPTTLDAKKSPLALLAQTCSQIGADSPNTKLLQSAEKSSKSSKSAESVREKSSPASSNSSNHSINDLSTTTTTTSKCSSFKPYEISIGGGREKTRSPEERASSASTGSRVRTPVTSSKNSVSGARCGSNQSAASPRSSPANVGRKTPASSTEGNNSSSQETSPSTRSNDTRTSTPNGLYTLSTSSANSKSGFSPSVLTSSSSDPALKDIPLGTFKPGVSVPISSAFLGAYGGPGLPMPADLMASSLLSQHHHALKSGGLSPYLSYARMKGPTGADSLVPVCRDPYCTGCSLSSHLLATSTASGKTPGSCPAGCVQCDHASKAPGYLGHSPAAAAYAHAQLAALAAASQLPYVCNWIAGDASYCGKRFSSSEELLQHLRTHTSVGGGSDAASSAMSMMSPTGLPPTHPLLHRTYPTPPLSPLATARFHPYSKPTHLLPPSLATSSLGFPLGHPGLPPYFSPYSLYGARLGAASGMHP